MRVLNILSIYYSEEARHPLLKSMTSEIDQSKSEISPEPRQLSDFSKCVLNIINQIFYENYSFILQIFIGCGTIEHITAQNHKGEVIIRFM